MDVWNLFCPFIQRAGLNISGLISINTDKVCNDNRKTTNKFDKHQFKQLQKKFFWNGSPFHANRKTSALPIHDKYASSKLIDVKIHVRSHVRISWKFNGQWIKMNDIFSDIYTYLFYLCVREQIVEFKKRKNSTMRRRKVLQKKTDTLTHIIISCEILFLNTLSIFR